jgi:hypothetical protein
LTDRDQRAVGMAKLLLEGHPLSHVASAYRVSPSWASREMRGHLSRVDPDLCARATARLVELRGRRQSLAANARWAQHRSSLYEQLRGACRRLERARSERNAAAAADEAARAHALIDRIAEVGHADS